MYGKSWSRVTFQQGSNENVVAIWKVGQGHRKGDASVKSDQLLSRVRPFATPWTAARQASLPSPTLRACSNSCPLSRWRHPTISSSIIPFSCIQFFPASGSFRMSQFFASGGQSFGVSASVSVLPMKIQDWFPLGWTGRISLQSKGPSTVFSWEGVWT